MVTLRNREKKVFTGFTSAEIEKMENLLKERGEQSPDREFYKRLAKRFNSCKDRSGKPALKWAEVETWFREKQQSNFLKNGVSVNSAKKLPAVPKASPDKVLQTSATSNGSSVPCGGKVPDLTMMEFEARSMLDGAWYDVEKFITYRPLSTGEVLILVRFVGFGADHDEWVNANDTRERSLPLEPSECSSLEVGDLVVCFQEREEMARYFDAHIIAIQRKMHDVRGCRCLFLVKYDHDTTEDRVKLNRLCRRPSY